MSLLRVVGLKGSMPGQKKLHLVTREPRLEYSPNLGPTLLACRVPVLGNVLVVVGNLKKD